MEAIVHALQLQLGHGGNNDTIYTRFLLQLRDGIGLSCLQEAAIAAQYFLSTVSGQLQESIGGEHDGAVWQVRIGYHEVLLDSLHSGRQIQRHSGERLRNLGLSASRCCALCRWLR